jgi:hypothetical protein
MRMNGAKQETNEKLQVATNVWQAQFDWLTERRKDKAGRISRSMSDVIREIIDDAMHYEDMRMGDA